MKSTASYFSHVLRYSMEFKQLKKLSTASQTFKGFQPTGRFQPRKQLPHLSVNPAPISLRLWRVLNKLTTPLYWYQARCCPPYSGWRKAMSRASTAQLAEHTLRKRKRAAMGSIPIGGFSMRYQLGNKLPTLIER